MKTCPECEADIPDIEDDLITCPKCENVFENRKEAGSQGIPRETPKRKSKTGYWYLIPALILLCVIPPAFTMSGSEATEYALSLTAVLVLGVAAFYGYFAPSIIAKRHHHKNLNALVALNIFLGWTFIGWVVALVWALMKQQSEAGEQ